MISGLVQLLLFQGLGELVSRIALPALPGPVIGLVLLLATLQLRGKVGQPLVEVSEALGRHLGLLFVPAAVGVVLFLPQLRDQAMAIGCALVVSVVATIAASALILRLFGTRDSKHG